MQLCNSATSLVETISHWKAQGDAIAFVPTMGNLHSGHIALVEHAGQLAKKVVVSIFVNPMQFGVNEDFDSYPRTLEQDKSALEKTAAALLFLPNTQLMYPVGIENSSFVEVPHLGDVLCGMSRPGHFRGVTTIVNKLFNLVQPDIAVFGEKDYQQLIIIRKMVRDLFMPVQVIGVETVREADGLAKSSRNQYLTPTQRALAPRLIHTMREMVTLALSGSSLRQLESSGIASLNQLGFEAEYLNFRHCDDLSLAEQLSNRVRLFAAARLGSTRLIDNIPAY